MFDLVICGGKLFDGIGVVFSEGDIVIKDGVIVKIGMIIGEGVCEIDVCGQIVILGFVDIYIYYDGQVSWDVEL